jgi:hypothetical protein
MTAMSERKDPSARTEERRSAPITRVHTPCNQANVGALTWAATGFHDSAFAALEWRAEHDESGMNMSSDEEKNAATVVMQTLPPELLAAATEVVQAEEEEEEDKQEAATEAMAAVDPAQIQAASSDASDQAQPLPRSRRRREKAESGGFSETQWFMKGAEIDADMLETVDDEEYDRNKKITEDEREGFTLRKDED